jgi:hypothetical protein
MFTPTQVFTADLVKEYFDESEYAGGFGPKVFPDPLIALVSDVHTYIMHSGTPVRPDIDMIAYLVAGVN